MYNYNNRARKKKNQIPLVAASLGKRSKSSVFQFKDNRPKLSNNDLKKVHHNSNNVVQREIIIGDKIETLQELRLWLDKNESHHKYNDLARFLPKMIEDINSNHVIRLGKSDQQKYIFDYLISTPIADKVPLDKEDKKKRDAFDQSFQGTLLTPLKSPQHMGQWLKVRVNNDSLKVESETKSESTVGAKEEKKEKVMKIVQGLTSEEVEMYKKIQAHLLNKDLVFKVLNRINNLMGKVGPNTLTGEEWHKELLGGLAKSGINQNSEPIKTLLDPKPFLDATTGSGNLPLDTGADKTYYETLIRERKTKPLAGEPKHIPKHGALSHTIQWLIIQEGIQKSREAIPLLHLFKRAALFDKSKNSGKTPSVWSSLVDLPPTHGFVINATMPEGLTTLIDKHFPHIKAVESEIEKKFIAEMNQKKREVAMEVYGANKQQTTEVSMPINKPKLVLSKKSPLGKLQSSLGDFEKFKKKETTSTTTKKKEIDDEETK